MTQKLPVTKTKPDVTIGQGWLNARSDSRLAPAVRPMANPARPLVQAKFTIGEPDDSYEREADRVADQVMRMPDSTGSGESASTPTLANTTISRLRRQQNLPGFHTSPKAQTRLQRRQTEEQEEEDEAPVQAKFLTTDRQSVRRQSEEEKDEETVQASFMAAGQQTIRRQSEEEEETLQSKASSARGAEAGPGLSSQIQGMRGRGSELGAQTRRFFEARFGRDFGAVRIHSGNAAARAAETIRARAFTLGTDIVFGAGQFQPHNEGGKHLLAHELTHVVQQNPDRVQRKSSPEVTPLVNERIQPRRLPPGASVSGTVASGSPGAGAHRRGLATLVSRAMAELNPVQQAAVRTRARGALSVAHFAALRSWERNQRLADAIRHLHPDLRHGHPNQFSIGPRNPGETVNLANLVTLANAYFLQISTNMMDADIDQVFGAANRATVKARYALARTRMNALHAGDKIFTDRSGYTDEVNLGGLTDSTQIIIDPHSMDNPADNDSIVTMIHEAMHAGNNSIVDLGYNDGSLVFRRMSSARKLNNAAHYEVPVWRALQPSHSHAHNQPPAFTTGLPFVPAGPGAPLTVMQRGVEMAKDKFENSWSSCLDVHEIYMDLFQHPARWPTRMRPRFAGAHVNSRYRNTLPFWSKVSKLTMHQRLASISHSSANIARRPVTRIDLALSEGVARKLSRASDQLPSNQVAAQAFITANASTAQRTHAAGNAARIRNLLVRLVLQHRVGRITGGIHRDLAMVNKYAWADANDFSRLLRPRNLSAFPYP